MSKTKLSKNSLEVLEARIAPAAVTPLLPTSQSSYVKATLGAPVEVNAGEVLTTTGGADGGYILYVEKGNAFVYFTDFNNNRNVDFNELTGIAAGDGLRITLFTDVHGDIVTNLRETNVTFTGSDGQPIVKTLLTLSDSDNNPSNDSLFNKGDGRVLLNKTIEKVELRSLQITDIGDQDGDGDVDPDDIGQRKLPSTYSIFGNIYAGRGFGAEDGGLIIDSTGGANYGFALNPTIGSIKTGTAVSGEYFSFGVSSADDASGTMIRFTPPRGQAGGDIIGVNSNIKFNVDQIVAGDGGFGARGGNIQNVHLNGDDTGGYVVSAGNGGGGLNGGAGGSIVNFSDLGSSTGKVVIRSGTGGTGATGSGGDGGTFSFENFNVRGDVSLELGDGGEGFTQGGAGASLTKGNFTQPDFTDFFRGNAYGTTHLPSSANWQEEVNYTPIFGTHEVVDFDGDGFGDFVYTTRTTSQVVVMFGASNGTFRMVADKDGFLVPDRAYLSGVRNPEALTVGDFDGDGHPDIAVASLDQGAHSGIAVFLSQFDLVPTSDPADADGVIQQFKGFSLGRFSAIGDIQELGAPLQISNLAAGDFNGDGVPDLAVIATLYNDYETDEFGAITRLEEPFQVLIFMVGDSEVDNVTGQRYLTGQFYADFSADIPATVLNRDPGTAQNIVMEATALSTTSTNDVVLIGVRAPGSNQVQAYDFAGNVVRNPGSFDLGQVDTNRRAGNDNVNLTDANVQDFTVLDYNADGNADIVAITRGITFMVASKGTGNPAGGLGTPDSGSGDQAGNYRDPQAYSALHAIKSLDVNGDGKIDDVAILTTKTGPAVVVEGYTAKSGADAFSAVGTAFTVEVNVSGNDEVLFDIHHPKTDGTGIPQYGVGLFGGGNGIGFAGVRTPPTLIFFEPLYSTGFKLSAGDGGDSSVGSGGKGGSLGGGAKIVTVIDSLTGLPVKELEGSLNLNIVGDFRLISGDGGDGFANGGSGGDVSGVVTRYRTLGGIDVGLSVYAEAGRGGRGVSGRGGSGGNIQDSSLEAYQGGSAGDDLINFIDPVTLVAGNGGAGSIGGAGGSVLGNGSVVPDALASAFRVTAGNGGEGTKRGGAGGSIEALTPSIRIPDDGVTIQGASSDGIGLIVYQAGSGGSAVAGRGGDGGSINNSSPLRNAYLSSVIQLTAGDAGSGTVGGKGGSVLNFELSLVGGSDLPLGFSAIAGHGGSGFAGVGGAGGAISNVIGSSRSLNDTSRILAGNGGASAAGTGGRGGSVVDVVGRADQGAYAVVAGAGGTGLTAGGRGGNIVNAEINVGSGVQAKVLAIAGAGGDASAYVTAAGDERSVFAFGGTIGRGGSGGKISGFQQFGSTGAHADLIGGNGGSTLNYGSVFDSRSYVGRGGSVTHVRIDSDIGNVAADLASTPTIDENVPIKSYNNIFAGETIVDFVEAKLRLPGSTPLTDADGNVGIVVGAAGRNKAIQLADGSFETQPASDGVNGSLIDVSARNLMSAVAGSVDRIASIQVTQGLKIPNGIIGADKGSFLTTMPIDPTPPDETGDNKGPGSVNVEDYLLTDANTPVAFGGPVLDGALIDGAVVTKVLLDDRGNPTNLDGRVYPTNQPSSR